MIKLSLDDFCNQWAPGGSPNLILSRLQFNIRDFTTMAGEESKRYFQNSFSSGGFNGIPWKPRTSRWGKKHGHPVMIDRGELKNSIKGEQTDMNRSNIGGWSPSGRRDRIFRRGAAYFIWTNESSIAERGKRGLNRSRKHSYAAIHNTAPQFHNFTVNQHSARKPEQRQFIGFSPSLNDSVAAFIDVIFKGIPVKC